MLVGAREGLPIVCRRTNLPIYVACRLDAKMVEICGGYLANENFDHIYSYGRFALSKTLIYHEMDSLIVPFLLGIGNNATVHVRPSTIGALTPWLNGNEFVDVVDVFTFSMRLGSQFGVPGVI